MPSMLTAFQHPSELDLVGFMDDEAFPTGTNSWLSYLALTDIDSMTTICEEIESLYSDYYQLSNNWPCEQRCVQLMLLEKANGDPNYFTKLARGALATGDKRLQDLLLTAGSLSNKSVDFVAATFRSWFDVIIAGRSAVPSVTCAYDNSSASIADTDTSSLTDSDSESDAWSNQQESQLGRRKRSAEDTNVPRKKRGRSINHSTNTPKGVYKTRYGFRVQLSVRPVLNSVTSLHRADNGNIKFSRNCKDYEQALWLYEIIFMISDQPHQLNDLISRSNYGELYKISWPTSTDGQCEYYRALGSSIDTLHDAGILKPEEHGEARAAYQSILPPKTTV